MDLIERKKLWNKFYSEVVTNMLTQGVYNQNCFYPFNVFHDAKSFNIWLKTMKSQFETEDINVLEKYTQQFSKKIIK